jgi:hypothetical protein
MVTSLFVKLNDPYTCATATGHLALMPAWPRYYMHRNCWDSPMFPLDLLDQSGMLAYVNPLECRNSSLFRYTQLLFTLDLCLGDYVPRSRLVEVPHCSRATGPFSIECHTAHGTTLGSRCLLRNGSTGSSNMTS